MLAQEWKQRLAACLSPETVHGLLQQSLADLFKGSRARVFSLDDLGKMSQMASQMTDNPVAKAFLDEEAALHEAQIVDNATWRKLCSRADHGHVLMGPLLVAGALGGIVAVTRDEGKPAFGASELRLMNSLCLYASGRLSELLGSAPRLPWSDLSARESEVAVYVGQGLRNSEIARRLLLSEHTVKQNLKSVFRKLGLRSRTELALHAARRA